MKVVNMQMFVNKLLIFLFLIQGVSSFWVGDVHENMTVKYFKYVLFLLFIMFNINRDLLLKIPVFLFSIFLFLYLYFTSKQNPSVGLDFFISRTLNFFFPFLLILVPKNIVSLKSIVNVLDWLIITSCVFCFIEYSFFQEIVKNFNMTERGGTYRCISFFINPNNAGTIFSFLLIYSISMVNKNRVKYLFYIFSLIVSIFLTGSKTPVLLLGGYYFAYCLLYIIKKQSISTKVFKYFIYVSSATFVLVQAVSILSYYDIYKFREVTSVSDDGRYTQILNFLELIQQDFFFPGYKIHSIVTYDNNYMQTWVDFGFSGLVLHALLLFSIIVFYYKRISISLVAFIVSWFLLGFALTSFYIWPLAYVFYFIFLHKIDFTQTIS